MHLIVLTGIIVLMLGLIALNQQVIASGKHESNTSNEDQTKESNHLSNESKMVSTGDSTTYVPTVGNVVIPLQETVVQQQNKVMRQVIQAVHTEYLENSLNTISTQADNINDTTLLLQLNNSAQ